MEKRELTCIGCPLGCQITVEMENKAVLSVTGNTCPRGKAYAEKEVTNPTRIVTSTVRTKDADRPYISVKTREDIPKGMIFEVMREINKITAQAPVEIGDVLLDNVAGTGAAVIATRAAAKI